jgi:hypothetical protein
VIHFKEENDDWKENMADDTDADSRKELGKELFRSEVMSSRALWLDGVISERNLLSEIHIPCKVHYWYAHALVASSSLPMVYDTEIRGVVQEQLLKMLSCEDAPSAGQTSSVTSEMQEFARQQLEEINFMVQYVDGELEDP